MLIHSCVTVSSLENARTVFEDVFGFKFLYSFDIQPEILNTLFNLDCSAQARIYDTGNSRLEIFILPEMPAPGKLQHICLGFPDKDKIVGKAQNAGMHIRKYCREDGEVIFVVDKDNNLFELKTLSQC
ncbi:VOC family protein [bacterium]|nr:VOC family protein [bacterium]